MLIKYGLENKIEKELSILVQIDFLIQEPRFSRFLGLGVNQRCVIPLKKGGITITSTITLPSKIRDYNYEYNYFYLKNSDYNYDYE